MTKLEFHDLIKERLEADGFIKVRVSVSLFGQSAEVTARDTSGTKTGSP